MVEGTSCCDNIVLFPCLGSPSSFPIYPRGVLRNAVTPKTAKSPAWYGKPGNT